MGGFSVLFDNKPVASFRSTKVKALFAYLTIELHTSHDRGFLAYLLWPDRPESVSRQNLRQSLYVLTRALSTEKNQKDSFLHCSAASVRFNTEMRYRFDVGDLTAAFAKADLEKVAAVFRGDLLAGFPSTDSEPFEAWLDQKRKQLRGMALNGFERLVGRAIELDDLSLAQQYAARAIELDPWREEAHRQLMSVLAVRGEGGAALDHFEKLRRIMDEDLSVAPDPATFSLYEQIKDSLSCPPLPLSAPPAASSIPFPASPFVGRAKELSILIRKLASPECRLLTVTGLGGAGKSRLALQLLHTIPDAGLSFPDGLRFAPLDGVYAGKDLPEAILNAVNLVAKGEGSARSELLRYLRGREMLLVLDNYEQILPDVMLIVDILRTAPRVRLLITSREPLSIYGETVLDLGGMKVPPEWFPLTVKNAGKFSALSFFSKCAKRALPGFSLSAETLPYVVRIVRQVGGLPLAIEHAAAWVRNLPISEIADEIERSFGLLSQFLTGLPERHHSVEGIIAEAWNRLSGKEQDVGTALAVLGGEFSRQASRTFANATPAVLASLIGRSLIRLLPSGRYEMHPLARRFAMARMQADPGLACSSRHSHSIYFIH